MTRIGKIFAVFIAITLQNWADESFAQGGPPPAPPVVVAKPIAKRIVQWDEYTGRFEPVAQVEVRARVSGFVDQVHFRDGQIVRQGDLLFTIDKRPYETRRRSRGGGSAAGPCSGLARGKRGRARGGLTRNQTITARDVDTRRSNLSVARAGQAAAEANLKSAQLNLEWTQVRAPLAGRFRTSASTPATSCRAAPAALRCSRRSSR